MAGRLFQCFEQGIGCDGVHALGRKDQHRLATPAGIGALRKLHRIAHRVNPDLFAGFAGFLVNLVLGFLGQGPAQLDHHRFGHQHFKVSMGVYGDGVAAGTNAACALRCGVFAQPARNQCQGQLILTQARRTLKQPSMTPLAQQIGGLPGNPRGLKDGAHEALRWSQSCMLLDTAALTAWMVWAASMRAKRAGISACRRA